MFAAIKSVGGGRPLPDSMCMLVSLQKKVCGEGTRLQPSPSHRSTNYYQMSQLNAIQSHVNLCEKNIVKLLCPILIVSFQKISRNLI